MERFRYAVQGILYVLQGCQDHSFTGPNANAKGEKPVTAELSERL
ncbi:hypothetical protein M446_4954 [Methylobacterium sp. 4-46]|nr:hypothetical protein M446_4954 [Methylobacterium sp. 4-46]